MLFEDAFLENADVQKLRMFRVLKSMNDYGFTITDLSNHLHISYQQSYNVFQELLNDLENLTGRSGPVVKKNVLSGERLPITVDQYRLFLLQGSVQFQFLDYVFQTRDASTDRFCQEHFISRSTLTRKTAPLSHLLASYELKLSFTKPDITGTEQSVRQFAYIFYWLSFRGVEWPFATIPQERMAKRYVKMPANCANTVDQLRSLLMLAINEIRITHGHILRANANFDQLLAQHNTFPIDLLNHQWYPRLSDAQFARENLFFCFQRTIEYNFAPHVQAWSPLYDAIMRNDNVVHQYVDELLQYLEPFRRPGCSMELTDDPVLLANLVRVALANIVGGPSFPSIVSFSDPERELYMHSRLYQTLLDAQPQIFAHLALREDLADASYQHICEELCYLLAPHLVDFQWEQVVNCRILVTYNDFNSRRLSTFIKNMSFVHIMPETDNDAKADLVITSIDDAPLFQDDDSQPHVFVWNTDVSATDFYQLFVTVENLMFKKLGVQLESHPIL